MVVNRRISRINREKYLAGTRLSSTVSRVTFPPIFRFASTFTTTRTGLRRPTLTNSDNASVIVALNSPVRLCLGRAVRIRVRH